MKPKSKPLSPAVYVVLGASAIGVIAACIYVANQKTAAAKATALGLNGGIPSTNPTAAQLESSAFITGAQIDLVSALNPNSLNYTVADETGVADARFQQALTLYQQQKGLPVSSILDLATWNSLEAAAANG
jgi:hypothetical protein